MSWPLRYLAVGAFGFFAIGCSEKAEGPPTGPEFHTILNTSSPCDFQHIGQLANSFFKPPRQQVVKGLVDTLAAKSLYSVAEKNAGFDIMLAMDSALNVDAPSTVADPAAGSNLINHLLLCMYNPTSEAGAYPASFPDTFNVALTASLTGAFAHRTSGTAPVYARSATSTFGFSGIAPLSPGWGVTGTPARVVFYGRPATTGTSVDPLTYDWRTIPHNASFNPEIIVAVCVDAQATGNTTLMLNEQGVAVLSFVDAGFLPPPACSSSNTALLGGNRPFQLARGLIGLGSRLFTPTPLMAAVLNPGGVGGTSKRCCSKVGVKPVPSVSATLSNVKNRIQANIERFSLLVTAKAGTDFVNGTKFTLSTTVNSGTNTSVRVALPGTPCSQGAVPEGITGTGTNSAGTYLFTNLCFTNTGNVYIVGTANVEGRDDTPVTAKSNKIISYP
jgi:hypothetical protein